MITLTAKQLFQSAQAFAGLVSQRIKSPRLAYNLSKTWKAFQDEATRLRELEKEIYTRYGGADVTLENGAQAISVDMEKLSEAQRKEFQEETAQLSQVPVELWGHSLKLEEIEANAIELSPAEFAVLDWLIVEETETTIEKAEAKAA